MSELKARTARSIADEEEILELGADYPIEQAQVYLKSEADKVIAELERRLNEAHTELELWRDGSIISEEHQKELDGKRHANYKRCLANAETCMHKRWRTDEGFDYARSTRHMNKWLELAEKFKPNN